MRTTLPMRSAWHSGMSLRQHPLRLWMSWSSRTTKRWRVALTASFVMGEGGDASEFWHQLLARWRPASRLAWIPSHGKRPGWTPPAGYPSPDLCRAMNAAADSAAKQLAHDHGAGYSTVAQERRDAVMWASTAVQRQSMVTRSWWDLCLPHFAYRGEAWQLRN